MTGCISEENLAAPRMMDELIGKQFGGYEIRERVGRGGMASVYLALQTSMNRLVAVKMLPRDMMKDDSYLQRFTREVDIVAKLEHRNIVPVYDHGTYDGQPYIVMRYMSAGSVDDLLLKGHLPPEKYLNIIQQIAPALDYAHAKNVLHRDLKPSNVLMDDDGGAYITDFGIARLLNSVSPNLTITTEGVVGTPSYMSPEQAQGQPLDSRSDVYSLGIMLFEMATGRRPFLSDTPYSIAVMQVTTPPPSARSINPTISGAVEQVIYKALKKNPDDRYQTAGELAEALKMAIERPTDFNIHDTQRPFHRSALHATQPHQAQPAPQVAAYPQQLIQPQQQQLVPPQATPSALYQNPVVLPRPTSGKLRARIKNRNGNMWLSIFIGALIGCGLLTMVVIGVAFAVDRFVNSTSQLSTPTAIYLEAPAATPIYRTPEPAIFTTQAAPPIAHPPR